MAQTAAQKKAAEQAANKKLLAQAQALLEKQKAQLAALEKQQAEAAKIKADFEAEQKLAKEVEVKENAALRLERIRLEREAKEARDKGNAALAANPALGAVKGSNTFQMLGGILYFSGIPLNGTGPDGKKYINGILSGSAPDSTTNNDAVTIANQPVGLAVDTFRKTLALYFGETESKKPWVDSLYKTASGFYKTGSTAEESMNLSLMAARNDPNMKPFTDRFSAIYKLQDLKTSGVSVEVPTIAEFVKSQSTLGDVFRRSNLGDLATDAYTSELLGKGIAVSTVAENITKVFDVIDQAPKEVKDTINRFYPTADRSKLAKALLTGTKGIADLEKEVKGYQILAAAETQGVGQFQGAGVAELAGGITAEQASNFAAGGTTFQAALTGFGQVAQARTTEQKLAEMSGQKSMGVSGLAEAVIGKKASALSELERLTLLEENRFKARSGTTSASLASERRGAGQI
jgi:hypothetical protein